MCLIIFAHQASPQFPLLIAANRDEFHQRPTAPSQFWEECPDLLAGRDMQAGGTWMGVTRSGRFAAVTNYRDPNATATALRSRGELPLQFLKGHQTPSHYLTQVAARAHEYAGFNLLLGDADALWYLSNGGLAAARTEARAQQLKPGVYGLSNASLDTPWPKVLKGKRRLAALLKAPAAISHEMLVATVSDRALAEPEELTGQVGEAAMERLLSAQFIQSPSYGTRSSTTLRWDQSGEINWQETSYQPDGYIASNTAQKFVAGR